MGIRPTLGLQNHYPDVKQEVEKSDSLSLAKNGYSSLTGAGLDHFDCSSASIESALDAADRQAATTSLRYTHDEVFGSLRDLTKVLP